MGVSIDSFEDLPAVSGVLKFVEPGDYKPRTYEYEPPAGVPPSSARWQDRIVAIRDVRSVAAGLSLEREGVHFAEMRSALATFDDEDRIRSTYYPESERLVAELTGASRVVTFDHTIRRHHPGREDRLPGVPRQPVRRVHVDYTLKSAPQRVRDVLPDEADELLKRRFAVINVWRPLRGPVQDAPLALADAGSVPQDDLVAVDLLYPNRTGEIYYVRFNRSHRWFYVPRMTPDEVLLFKCFDSADDGRARFAPHAAFDDPTEPRDAAPRESIELRTLAFYSD